MATKLINLHIPFIQNTKTQSKTNQPILINTFLNIDAGKIE